MSISDPLLLCLQHTDLPSFGTWPYLITLHFGSTTSETSDLALWSLQLSNAAICNWGWLFWLSDPFRSSAMSTSICLSRALPSSRLVRWLQCSQLPRAPASPFSLSVVSVAHWARLPESRWTPLGPLPARSIPGSTPGPTLGTLIYLLPLIPAVPN